MRKIISIGAIAREELAKGANYLADAVKLTLGPHGQNFFLDKKNTITNDGVSVAREIQLVDEVQNRGATALREAAIKTNDEVGDGTTTAIVLAQAIYQEASKFLGKENIIGKKTPAEIIKQIERERVEVTDSLTASATPIETKEQLVESATVAVEDADLGKLIGEAQWELGKDGVLIAEESAERQSFVEKVHGIRIDNGMGTSQIINNHEKQTLEINQTRVVLTSHTIRDISDWQKVMKLVEMIVKAGSTTITIIARAWTDDTIRFCLENINKGAIKIYPLNAPYTDMQERMKDLQSIVGGTFVDSENSSLSDLNFSDVGYAEKIIARRFDAIITGKDSPEAQTQIDKRIEELTKQKDGSQSEFEKKTLGARIAQLQNGFAVVHVGSVSDMERRRLFDKCEDAVNAVRAALQEGTIEGAGLAFKKISDQLPDSYLLKRPLRAPYEQIMSLVPSGFIVEDWVRDPLKVMRVALEKACAVASSFATAGGVITDEKPKPLDELFKNVV